MTMKDRKKPGFENENHDSVSLCVKSTIDQRRARQLTDMSTDK